MKALTREVSTFTERLLDVGYVRDVRGWIDLRHEAMKHHESIADGIERTPDALFDAGFTLSVARVFDYIRP